MATPKITLLVWNLVDKPWDFYGVRYILDDYEHIVYIPARTIEEELKTKNIVQIVCEKLRAKLACKPVHVLRVNETNRVDVAKNVKSTQRRRKNKLDQSGPRNPWIK